jgi:hypothetical protein
MSLSKPIRRALEFQQRGLRFVEKRLEAVLNREWHQRQAEKSYGQIRKNQGKPELDPALARKVDAYAREVLGSVHFAPWLRVIALYQGRFAEGWMPQNFFFKRVIPGLLGDERDITRKRTSSLRYFDTDAIPDLAYRINGRWYDLDYRPLELEEVRELAFDGRDEVYVKEEGAYQGRAVRRVGARGFQGAVEGLTTDAVIQRPVVQHPWFDALYPDATITMRITTTFTDERGPQYRHGLLRTPFGGARIVKVGTNLLAAITDMDGSVAGDGVDGKWHPYDRHPDTGTVLDGLKIPHYRQAVETCLGLHAQVPHDPVIGWDVGITASGRPEIMEWNTGTIGISIIEALAGPTFLGCDFERFAGPP